MPSKLLNASKRIELLRKICQILFHDLTLFITTKHFIPTCTYNFHVQKIFISFIVLLVLNNEIWLKTSAVPLVSVYHERTMKNDFQINGIDFNEFLSLDIIFILNTWHVHGYMSIRCGSTCGWWTWSKF